MTGHVRSGYSETVVTPLVEHPILGCCTYPSLARLLPHLTEELFPAGTPLCQTGDPADTFFVIKAGAVASSREGAEPVTAANACCGEETLVGLPNYLATTVALSDVVALELPRACVTDLLAHNPGLRSAALQCLALPQTPLPALPGQTALRNKKEPSLMHLLGWLLTVACPALVLVLVPQSGLNGDATLFLAIFSATVCMWIFSLADDFVPGLFAIVAILIMGIAPPSVILSGFASDGFLLAMSILGLSTVIVASGLSYRFMLWLLLKLPNTPSWANFGLMLKGILLTPVVPSINARVSLLAPLTIDMIDTLKCAPKGPSATTLAITSFTGTSVLSAIFLSSKSVNFVIFGLLPQQLQTQFQWLYWLIAGAMAGVIMLGAYALLFLWLQRNVPAAVIDKERVAAQLDLLGPLKQREWSAFFGIMLFITAVLSASLHKIQPPWVALTILYALLIYGFLDKKEFNQKIDWPFLVYLAGIVGIVGTFNHVGLDSWLAEHLEPLGALMRSSLSLFILFLASIIFVIRLIVPISTTIVITATVFVPLANSFGINAWAIGFMILMLGEMWYFPYQCSYYVQFRNILGADKLYDERQFLRINALMNLAKLAAIFGSLPYWRMLGIL